MLNYPIHHHLQVGSISFLQNDYVERAWVMVAYYVVCFQVLFSEFRVAVVLGISIPHQVGPCHCEFLNHFHCVPAISQHQSVLEITSGIFCYRFVCFWLFIFSLCLHWHSVSCVTGGYHQNALLAFFFTFTKLFSICNFFWWPVAWFCMNIIAFVCLGSDKSVVSF